MRKRERRGGGVEQTFKIVLTIKIKRKREQPIWQRRGKEGEEEEEEGCVVRTASQHAASMETNSRTATLILSSQR